MKFKVLINFQINLDVSDSLFLECTSREIRYYLLLLTNGTTLILLSKSMTLPLDQGNISLTFFRNSEANVLLQGYNYYEMLNV